MASCWWSPSSAVALAVWLGPAWAGLLIYVSVAAAGSLPESAVWPAVVGAAAVCATVVAVHGLFADLFILPLICLLTAFALRGTRYLVSVNAELAEARDELARNAVAEERVRFARDLHDLLGHSLSLIALKSELAGRLVERDPARARAEMADVEAAARRALAEVRDAVSGYRTVSLAQALAEARSALSAAGITLRAAAPASRAARRRRRRPRLGGAGGDHQRAAAQRRADHDRRPAIGRRRGRADRHRRRPRDDGAARDRPLRARRAGRGARRAARHRPRPESAGSGSPRRCP